MTKAEELARELDSVDRLVAGRKAGVSELAIVDVLEQRLPELRRLRGEAWLEQQARALKPRRPRDTAAKRRRALLAEVAAAERS